jgi:hypothetical protein
MDDVDTLKREIVNLKDTLTRYQCVPQGVIAQAVQKQGGTSKLVNMEQAYKDYEHAMGWDRPIDEQLQEIRTKANRAGPPPAE